MSALVSLSRIRIDSVALISSLDVVIVRTVGKDILRNSMAKVQSTDTCAVAVLTPKNIHISRFTGGWAREALPMVLRANVQVLRAIVHA